MATPFPPLPADDVWGGDLIEAIESRFDDSESALIAAIVELVTGPTYYTATNLIPVPDYAAFPNGWKYQGAGSGAVVDNTLTVTGTGAISAVGVYSDRAMLAIPAGHKVYVRAVVTSPTQAASYSVSLSNGSEYVYVNGATASVPNPAVGVPVAISAVLTIPATWTPAQGVSLFQLAYQSSAAVANGAKVSFAPPVVIDLTETYGAGEEPEKAHLDAIVGALPQPVRAVAEFDKHLPKTPTYNITNRSQAGPPVILRFDDGYVNNLTNAAPILEEHGFRGTLYTVTRPDEWAGAPFPMLTPGQKRELAGKYRWEVGSHMTTHEDANQGDPYVWIEKLRTSCQDLLDAGLPWPRTFAYPNGSRNVVTDRGVYRLFNNAGLTGHPTLSPARRDAPTFFHRWATINGLSPESGIEQAKAYVRESAAKGEVPILGFHGVTDGAPPASHHISKADLTAIVGWLAAEGYSTITAGELMPHNLIGDPGFETRAFGYPWVEGAGWTRTRSTVAGHTGYYGADLATGGTGSLSQNVAAQAGTQYRVRVRIGAGSSVTGGTVTVRVQPQTPMGTAVGSPLAVGTVPVSVVAETDVTAIVTMPSGAGVAKLEVVPSAFTGAVRVTHAALYRADLHDPLA